MLFVATDFVQHINICYFVQQMIIFCHFVQQINICCFVATNWICSTNEQMESPLRGLFKSAHWTSVEQILFNRLQNVEHMLKYSVRTPPRRICWTDFVRNSSKWRWTNKSCSTKCCLLNKHNKCLCIGFKN